MRKSDKVIIIVGDNNQIDFGKTKSRSFFSVRGVVLIALSLTIVLAALHGCDDCIDTFVRLLLSVAINN